MPFEFGKQISVSELESMRQTADNLAAATGPNLTFGVTGLHSRADLPAFFMARITAVEFPDGQGVRKYHWEAVEIGLDERVVPTNPPFSSNNSTVIAYAYYPGDYLPGDVVMMQLGMAGQFYEILSPPYRRSENDEVNCFSRLCIVRTGQSSFRLIYMNSFNCFNEVIPCSQDGLSGFSGSLASGLSGHSGFIPPRSGWLGVDPFPSGSLASGSGGGGSTPGGSDTSSGGGPDPGFSGDAPPPP